MKTPETPFIGPRPRQSFAPRKVRPCGRKDAIYVGRRRGPLDVRSLGVGAFSGAGYAS